MADQSSNAPMISKRKRRVSLSIEEICLLVGCLKQITIQPAKDLQDRLDRIIAEELNQEHRDTVDAYRAAVKTRDGEIEVDDDAEVSFGDDAGAYVMVWMWVPEEDL